MAFGRPLTDRVNSDGRAQTIAAKWVGDRLNMTLGRVSFALIVATSVACGLIAGYWLAPSPSVEAQRVADVQERQREAMAQHEPNTLAGTPPADYFALKRKLEEERALREALEAKLSRALAGRSGPVAIDRPADRSRAVVVRGENNLTPKPQTPIGRPAKQPQKSEKWFNRAALVESGLSSSEIQEIETRWEQYEMEKLYLTDEATREGTAQSKQFHEQLAEINRQIRDDLGNDSYDAFLFATGKHNRVVLKQVIANSPAGDAGLRAGDVVVRYGGERVFHPVDFKNATSRGDSGAATSLDVWRDGEVLQFSVGRGPLGVQLQPKVAAPDRSL